jgi:ApaG protein
MTIPTICTEWKFSAQSATPTWAMFLKMALNQQVSVFVLIQLRLILKTMSNVFVAENNNFRIEVRTAFDFDQSNPLNYHYLFKYTILIINQGAVPAQLLSRKWNIKDANGKINIVEGPGVVGHTPHFDQGGAFEYSSFCPLPTMTGEMWGHFNMINKYGQSFSIDTPLFRFHVPSDYIDTY